MYRPDDLAVLIGSKHHSGAVAEAGDLLVGHIASSRPSNDATVVEAGYTWSTRIGGEGPDAEARSRDGRLLIADAQSASSTPKTTHTRDAEGFDQFA